MISSIFRKAKQLQLDGNAYDGHIIIFTNISQAAMQNAANYLWNSDRLPKTQDTFLLVFMHEEFLTRLWDLIHDHSIRVLKRWYSLAEIVVAEMRVANQGGYTLLDKDVAEAVIKKLLKQPPIENPINRESLLEELKDQVRQSANRKRKPDRAASK